MRLSTRKLLDRSFTWLGLFSILLMAGSLLVLLAPIFARGVKAFVFRETVEHRRFLLARFNRGDREAIEREYAAAMEKRQVVFRAIEELEALTKSDDRDVRRKYRPYRQPLRELENLAEELLGPIPGEEGVLPRENYGPTRWGRAEVALDDFLHVEEWDYSDPSGMGRKALKPRVDLFRDTPVEPVFAYTEEHIEEMLLPRWTFYWGFFTDKPVDACFFGGIWPAILGTFYLTVGAMLIAAPMGIISAIYLVEYAGDTRFISLLRACISTLAGVPSIVFGLFGLAFFINTLHVSDNKSVLAGSLTLALLVLPTVIRASEEAIRAVPGAYREAALSLGATKWRAIVTVILPASLSGILTSIIISMGRAAGETAPIIFTAAVSVGQPLMPLETLSQPTQALPWNIYNLATEHEAVDEIRHVQYGMVLTLVVLVLALNLAAVVLRARIARKLRG